MNTSFQGEKKCLAYIWPIEDYIGKETALANVRFVTGPFKGKVARYYMPTNIYTYYFWGATFEVVTITANGAITAVTDIKREDLQQFDLNLIHALTFNNETKELLGSNGFVYKLSQSLFYRNCKPVCEYIYKEIETARNFAMQIYTLNGGIISILFEKNLSTKDRNYKYAIFRGFITADDKLLRSMIPKTDVATDSHEVLNQSEIDKLIEGLKDVHIETVGFVDSDDIMEDINEFIYK